MELADVPDSKSGGLIPRAGSTPATEKALDSQVLFNEICPAGKLNSCAVKYLLRKCEMFADANVANFISHPNEARIFHNGEGIISHRRSRYFTYHAPDTRQQSEAEGFFAKPVEKFKKLCYNELDKSEFVEVKKEFLKL